MVQKKDSHQYRPILSLTFLLLSGSLFATSSQAQVTPDQSLGAERSAVNQMDSINERIDGGARRGGNLFHSFQNFNINEGKGVYFANPQGVMNIFSRVTGGNPSNILGRLGVLGGSNLFFLNPYGIIFGPNASLDIRGSFVGSTARGIQFADGTFFGTDLSQSSPLLTISTPIGLQFTQAPAGPIVVQGSYQPPNGKLQNLPRDIKGPSEILNVVQALLPELLLRPSTLSVQAGKTIALVGGDVTLEGGRLTAGVDLLFLLDAAGANFTTSGGLLFLLDAPGVDFTTLGGLLFLLDAAGVDFTTSEYLSALGGRIEIGSVTGVGNVSLTPTLRGWALGYEGVENSALGKIQLSQLALLNASSTGGGEIQVRGRQVNLFDESAILAATFGDQNGGDIEIRVPEVNMVNGSIIGTGTIGTGNSGDVIIETDHLSVRGSSLIETATASLGKGGNITISARNSVNVVDDGFIATGILGGANSQTGDAGSVFIQTRTLNVMNGGEILNATSTGQGGNLILEASESVNVEDYDSAIYTDTYGIGNAGNINITTGYLTIRDGGKISAATLNVGKGGNIQIEARDGVELKGLSSDSGFPSGIFTSSGLPGDENFQPEGAGGNLIIKTGSLTLSDQALISASTISPGNAGNITITVAETLQATNSDITTSATRTSGGTINITAQDIRLQGDSDITTNVSSGTGSGGSITLTADSILAFNDSDILAFAQDGQGGNINLNTPIFFGNGYQTTDENQNPETLNNNGFADINASGVVSGIISVPDLTFIQNSLFELPETLINTENLIANSCVVPNQQKAGTFILTGSDGLPTRPNTNITSPYPTGTIETIPPASNSPPPKIDEPQGFYRLPDGRLILSRRCS